MKKKLLDIIGGNLLIKGSLIVLVGSVFSNLGSYLFHLVMGRLLGPADYGILESLISIIVLLGIPVSVMSLIVVKFVSQNSGQKEGISAFLKYVGKKFSVFGLFFLAVFLLLSPLFARLTKINSFPLFLGIGLTAYLSIGLSIISSTLQGEKRFKELSYFSVFTTWSKLLVGVFLVLLGWRMFGAVYSMVISSVLALVFGFSFLRSRYFLKKMKPNFSFKKSFMKIEQYSLLVLLAVLSLSSLVYTDIILARYYLLPVEAGQYAALSVMGKIIFFASSPVVSVMFPLVSESQRKKENYRRYMNLSILLVLGISAVISVLYCFFPEIFMSKLFGESYRNVSSLLGLFAVFLSLYSLCSLMINYYLSLFKMKPILWSALLAVLQVVSILFFHKNIQQVVMVGIFTCSLLLSGLLIYYLYERKEKITLGDSTCLPAGKNNHG